MTRPRMLDLTVGRSLRLAAERVPDRPAIVFGSDTLTHRELNALGNRIANGLLSAGLVKGDRVGVMLPNSILYVAIVYAMAKSGLVMVLLNYRFTGGEIAYQLADAGARALIYGAEYRVPVEQAKRELKELWTIAVGEVVRGDLAALQSLADSAPGTEPRTTVLESDPFYLGYTSGTTGRPKGAIITHRNRSLSYHYYAIEYGIGSDDIALHSGPFHHTAPLAFTLAQLCFGGRVAVMPAFDALEAVRIIEKAGVTWGFMVPYMYNAILSLSAEERRRYPLSSVRLLVSGGSPLPTPLKERLVRLYPHVGLHEFYGATEAGVVTNLRPRDQLRKLRCVGKPVLDVEVKVATSDGGDAAPGEVGELYFKTPTLFDGYFGAPDKTAAAFREGWCTLGDLGKRDEEGYFYIVDRVKDVIKSGGVNIYPVEIEDVLLKHASVSDAAVIGIPSDRWGEAVHAILVLHAGRQASAEEILALCRTELADYKVPKSLEIRAELPRSPAGKILKRLLRDEFWAGRSVRV